jgi:hypothetical protein
MAERGNPANTQQTDGAEAAAPQVPARSRLFQRLFTTKWLLIALWALVVIQGVGLAYYRSRSKPVVKPPSPEVTLGDFHFQADKAEAGRTTAADFTLHIALLEPAERLARERLATHKLRIRQDVEELLRRAHSGDFDDPALQELKRQLQEQICQSLGMRAISDVIITDVRLHRTERPGPSTADTAGPVASPDR